MLCLLDPLYRHEPFLGLGNAPIFQLRTAVEGVAWRRLHFRISRSQMGSDGVCYTLPMFIHRLFITGCSDRGAWPWRTPQTAHTLARA